MCLTQQILITSHDREMSLKPDYRRFVAYIKSIDSLSTPEKIITQEQLSRLLFEFLLPGLYDVSVHTSGAITFLTL